MEIGEVSNLTDEQLEAALSGDVSEADTTTETGDTTTEGESVTTTDAEPPADQVVTDEQGEQGEGLNPDGPGDLRVALKQERERAKAERERAEQLAAEAAELRAYRQQIEAQQYQAQTQQQAEQYRQQLAERLEFVDGQEAAAIVEEIRRIDAQQMQQNYQAYAANERLQFSASVMADAHPDFAEHLTRAYEEFGPALDQLALSKSPNNPAKWAYELGKRLNAEANFETRLAAELEKRLPAAVQEVLQKQKPPDTQGHKGIAHISADGVGGKTVTKSPSEMSDAELARALGY